jgi:hypothetical protein
LCAAKYATSSVLTFLANHIFRPRLPFVCAALSDVSTFNAKARDTIKVVKKTEEIGKEYLYKHDKVINELINQAIDIYVLKDKEKSERGLKNYYLLWDSLVKNFDSLVNGV